MLAKIFRVSTMLLLLWILPAMSISADAYSAEKDAYPASENATIIGDGVRLRSEPSLSGKILTNLNKEVRVAAITRTLKAQMIDGNYNFWYYINHDNLFGYVFGHFIKIDRFIVISVEGYTESDAPPIPFEDVGGCPFEGCTYREWTANSQTIIRETLDENSPIAFTVKAGEKVTGMTGVVITTKPGRIKILKPMTYSRSYEPVVNFSFQPGDIIYLLTDLGEGDNITWFKGKLYGAIPYVRGMEVENEPEYVWWVKVKNSKGQTGWSNQPRNFDNMDRFG